MKSILTILLLCVLSGPRVIAQTTKSGFIKTSDGVRIHYVGDKVRLERFDEDGHALFVDDPKKFNRTVDGFVQSLPKR